MTVAFVQEFKIVDDDRSTTMYDTIRDQLDLDSDPPEGLIVHTAGFDDGAGVFRILDIWQTRELAERFQQERLMPIVGKMMAERENAAPPDREGFYELHDLRRP